MAENRKKNKKAKKSAGELTPRQIKFCRAFVISGKKQQSAIKAGYTNSSAASQATELLKNPKIIEKIEELQKEAIERNKLSEDEIIVLMAKTAKDDIGNYCSWKTDTVTARDPQTMMEEKRKQVVVDWKDSDQIDTSNIKKIGFDKNGNFQIELYDSFTAKKTLGEWAGLNKVKEEKTDNKDLTLNINVNTESVTADIDKLDKI